MFISISKIGDRYSFISGVDQNDEREAFFCSEYDFDLIHDLKSDYPSYAEAHASGIKVIKNNPSAIMAKKAVFEENTDQRSPEERIVSHFSAQLNIIGGRIGDIEHADKDREEQAQSLINELASVKKSLSGILGMVEDKNNYNLLIDLLSTIEVMTERMQKLLPETASEDVNPEDAEIGDAEQPPLKEASNAMETLLEFGITASKALLATHKTAHVNLIEKDDETDSYFVHIAEENGDICSLNFNNKMLLTNVIPSTRVSTVYPYHKKAFLERYWEPIVTSVGHFLLPDKNVLVSTSSDDSSRFRFSGVDMSRGTTHSVSINMVDGSWWISDKDTSLLKTANTLSYDFGAEVRCIKKNLPTYYGRTGMVVKTIPRADSKDVVVDFRRGLGTIVLTTDDIESL